MYSHTLLTLDPHVLEVGSIYKFKLGEEEYLVRKDHQGRLCFHEVLDYELLKKEKAVSAAIPG